MFWRVETPTPHPNPLMCSSCELSCRKSWVQHWVTKGWECDVVRGSVPVQGQSVCERQATSGWRMANICWKERAHSTRGTTGEHFLARMFPSRISSL